jgi:ribosomal protein L37AE/L43A
VPVIRKSIERDVPDTLKPYIHFGVDLQWKNSDKDATADCPFCNRTNKFAVKIETGLWRCLVCNEGSSNGKAIKGGNAVVFIRTLWEKSKDHNVAMRPSLTDNRGLLSNETLKAWGVAYSITRPEWFVPAYNQDKALCNLYR